MRQAFPEIKGLSARNLKYMRAFAEAWPDEEFVQQAAAQIPWFHNVVVLEKVKDPQARRFYIAGTREHGWSRAILLMQIEQGLHRRQGQALSNFQRTLPPPQSDLVQQITKDDQPTIGILLCKNKEDVVVEYALRDLNKPIWVAGWKTQLVESLPEDLKGKLPTVEEIEAELSRGELGRKKAAETPDA